MAGPEGLARRSGARGTARTTRYDSRLPSAPPFRLPSARAAPSSLARGARPLEGWNQSPYGPERIEDSMLAELLPSTVAAVEVRTDPVDIPLFPEEEAHVRDAAPKRRAEFTAVRWCARRAMAGLGLPAAPVVPGRRGAPGWGPGLTGSMTHCAGFRAAALARHRDVRSLGIDAEPNTSLPAGILEEISLGPERRQIAALRHARPEIAWDRLLFSAKESVFKTWYPTTGLELGFHQALITFDPDQQGFRARLLTAAAGDSAPRSYTGRYGVEGGILATAIAQLAPALVPA
ncbi:4'-phosphopantetheinyl transferase family protein [Streptomyces murinus]|uniref:4'-phosphopantetheinyl transferase family protein n=1 Tax=Streptomyces murinus TaxID=33900 RepID=UPI00380590C8